MRFEKLRKLSRCDVHLEHRILSFCDYLWGRSRVFFMMETILNVGQKWDNFFLSTFVGCFMSLLRYERGFHLAMFCSFSLWKHLLRRFTDCAQLGFSSSSTFWFSASDAQECIRNWCRGSEKSLNFPRDVLCNFFVQRHIKPIWSINYLMRWDTLQQCVCIHHVRGILSISVCLLQIKIHRPQDAKRSNDKEWNER